MLTESRVGKNKEPGKAAALSRAYVLDPCAAGSGHGDQVLTGAVTVHLRYGHLEAHELVPFLWTGPSREWTGPSRKFYGPLHRQAWVCLRGTHFPLHR